MEENHFVVVGNGPAGTEAALTLRRQAPSARITVIGEGRKPGFAARLLPDYIAGLLPEEGLYPGPDPDFAGHDIKLRRSQEAVGLKIEERQLILAHREVLSFDGLILAVGSRPRIPERMLVFAKQLLTLKGLADARRWRRRLADTDTVLMIGGDLISLAVTKALLHLGKKVYFQFTEDAFWPLRCDGTLLAEVGERLERRGVTVVDGPIRAMARLADNTCEVSFDEGVLRVGLIGAFFGMTPDIGFLARSGLRLDRGVLVDEFLSTGHDGIYATGDCAQIYHPEIRDYWISIGHENARILGGVAAANLACDTDRTAVEPDSIFTAHGIRVNTSWWADF